MKVGVYVTNQHYLNKDMVSALDEQIAMVRLARDKGWDSFFTGHHYLNEGNNQALQWVPFLARLQAEAGHMACGIGILLLPLHNPVYVAETAASMDVICRGNFILGLGLGYRQMEFDAFQVPMNQRAKRFERHLTLIKRLWSEESVSFEDESCKLVNVRMNIRPVQKPHMPIWIAANNDPAVKRAARLGDCWMIPPHATLQNMIDQMALFRKERKAAGLAPATEVPCFREIVCAKDRATALELAGPYLAEKYAGYARWGQDATMPRGDTMQQALDKLILDRFILGSPEECLEQLRTQGKAVGVTHWVLRPHWPGMPVASSLMSMRLLSDEVLPALRKM
jgi:alkanesulfonate monooxygenase SsuD/methylene tetrahydromethanopterin reductase-like flavin-dependent oxidoreductase (luciferase family)